MLGKLLNNKTIQISLISLLFILAIVLLFVFSENVEEAPTPLAKGFTISMSEGEILLSNDGKTWKLADKSDLLTNGYRVRTGNDSRLKLLTPQGSVVSLDENSEIMISQLNLRDVLLIQYSGRTYHKVNTGQQGTYQVRALNHTIKATGTAFDITVNRKANRINTKVLEGKISVAVNFEDIFRTETIKSGKEITISPKHENLITYADISDEYKKSEWYKWNNNTLSDLDDEINENSKDDIVEENDTTTEVKKAVSSPITIKKTTVPATTSIPTSGCKPYLTAKKNNTYKGILLNWAPCRNSDFQFYKIVRSTINTNPIYPNDPVVSSSSNQSYSNFIDKTVASNRTYYYRVCVVQRLNKTTCGNKVSVAY